MGYLFGYCHGSGRWGGHFGLTEAGDGDVENGADDQAIDYSPGKVIAERIQGRLLGDRVYIERLGGSSSNMVISSLRS